MSNLDDDPDPFVTERKKTQKDDVNVQQEYQPQEGQLELEDAEQQLDDYDEQDELLATEVEAAEYRDDQAAQFDQYYAEEAQEGVVDGSYRAIDSERLSVGSADDDGGNLDDDRNSSKEKLTDRLRRRKSSYDATMATPSEKEAFAMAQATADQGPDMAEEEEDDGIEEEVWIPPSMELAQEHIEKHVYQEGKGKFWRGDLTKATDLSRGVVLHFAFLRNMAICLSVMTLLSIPSLIFCTNGSRIPLSLQDPIGLYKFTLGNIGYDPNSRTYLTDSACTQISDAKTYNGTCIHFQVCWCVCVCVCACVLSIREPFVFESIIYPL